MWVILSILMMLTGVVTLLSVAAQIVSATRGRALLITMTDMMTYVCLSMAGMGLLVSGLAKIFHGAPLWIAVPVAAWLVLMGRLVLTYRNARFAPRKCRCCGFGMVRLEGERFLNKTQKFEEKLKSREYDLWVCTCGHREIYRYGGRQELHFKKCPSCAVHAVYATRETVTPQGIYIDTHCAFCDQRIGLS
jgi:hypothetical protein